MLFVGDNNGEHFLMISVSNFFFHGTFFYFEAAILARKFAILARKFYNFRIVVAKITWFTQILLS